jgi:RNA-binding protein
MKKLKGFQREFLRGLANSMKPVIFIGQKGLTPAIKRKAERP